MRLRPMLALVVLVALASCSAPDADEPSGTESTVVESSSASPSTEPGGEAVDTTEPDGSTDTTDVAKPTGASITVAVDAIRAVALAEVIAEFTTATGVVVNLDVREFADLASAGIDADVDLFMGPHVWLDEFLADGQIAPADGVDADQFISIVAEALTRESELYGVPFSAESLVLYVNHDTYGPDTPTDLLRDCEGAPSLCFVMPGLGEAGGYHLAAFLMSDANQSYADQLAEPSHGAAGLELFRSLAASRSHSLTSIADARSKFLTGTPLFVGGPWDLGSIEEAGLAFSVVPIPSTGGATPSPAVSVLAFYRRATSPNPTDAALFLSWLSGPDEQRELWQRDRRAPVHVELTDLGSVADGFRAAVERGFVLPSGDIEVHWEELGAAAQAIYDGSDPVDAVRAAAIRIADRLR